MNSINSIMCQCHSRIQAGQVISKTPVHAEYRWQNNCHTYRKYVRL